MDAEKRREKELQKELAKLDPFYMSYFVPWNSYRNYQLAKAHGFHDLTHEWDRTHHAENFDQIDSRAYLVHSWLKYPKFGQFQNLCLAAQLLRKKSEDVEKILFLDPSPSEADGHVALTCHRPLFLHGEARLAFAFLGAYADEIYVNCFNDGPIRITFVVSGVWKE